MLFFADAFPGQIQNSTPIYSAAAHHPASGYWQSLDGSTLKLEGLTVIFGHSAPFSPTTLGRTSNSPASDVTEAPPNLEPPDISIEMVEDGVDQNGKWFQKLRVTLKQGGTLAEISEAIYGDVLHVDELLQIAKQRYPNIQRPQQLRVGDTIEITADPSATYVVKETQWDEAEGKLTSIFFNGGKEITYPNVKGGTLRLVDFPADSRVQDFKFKIDNEVLTIKPGSRLVEYAYRPGDTFQDVVKKIYGEVSANALQDFILQTTWTPDHWPPSTSEKKRLIVSTTSSWDDKRPASTGFPEDRIENNDSYRALMQKRSDVGIYPLMREGTGTLYRVAIINPTVTAKDASRLLYGSDDRYLSLATHAGISPTPDATGKVPASFNPPLLGRRFDVYVDYTEEWFPLGDPTYDSKSQRTVTRLSNGTVIEEYDQAFRHKDGTQRAIYYPTGYKKIVYRPSDIAYSSLDFLYFISNGLKEDPNSQIDKQKSENFIANFLWNWAPGIPRTRGDNPESFNVTDTQDGRMIEIVIGPQSSEGLIPFFYDLWLANPCLGALGVVFLATAVVFVLGMILKRRR